MNLHFPSPVRRHLGVPSSLFTVAKCALVLCLGVARLSAQTNLVTNGSFETQTFSPWNSAGVPGHMPSIENSGFANDGSDGRYLLNFSSAGSGANMSVIQYLTTVAGTTYDFSFDARYYGNLNTGVGLSYAVASYPSGSPTYLTGTLMVGTELTAAGFSGGNTTNWNHFSYSFTATGTSTRLTFQDVTPAGVGSLTSLQLDNISVAAVSAVPEPATYATTLAAVALCVTAIRRRKAHILENRNSA